MIFPFLDGLRGFRVSPVTWTIILINLTAFFLVDHYSRNMYEKWSELSKSDTFNHIQADMYSQYVLAHPENHGGFVRMIALKVAHHQADSREMLSSLALRDEDFLRDAVNFPFVGDQVAVRYWRERIGEIIPLMDAHPSYLFGISQEDPGLWRWFSYQFVHSGFWHIAGNMAFLAIFGSALESLIGGLALLLIYLGSGFIGAGIFLLMTDPSIAPLVGASGAIAGVMAFYAFYMGRKPVRFVLFLLVPRFHFGEGGGRWLMSMPIGIVYLPAILTWLMFFVSDLAGYLSSVDELGGVAHTAHLGGQLAGILVAFGILGYRRLRGESWNIGSEQIFFPQ